jgi:hypothetical protein
VKVFLDKLQKVFLMLLLPINDKTWNFKIVFFMVCQFFFILNSCNLYGLEPTLLLINWSYVFHYS